MNRISWIIVLAILQASFTKTFSQSLSNQQRRILNESLLELVKDYEKYSRFTTDNKSISESYIAGFSNLFAENALLYNDILPSNRISESVTIEKYLSELKRYYSKGIGVKIHGILFDKPEYVNNNTYNIRIELSKEIYGYTRTNSNYKDTIALVFKVSFDISGNQVSNERILAITGEHRNRFLKCKIFKFLTHKPIENAEITLDAQTLLTNAKGEVQFENIDPGKEHSLVVSGEYIKPLVFMGLNIDRFIEGNTDKNHKKMKYDYYDPNEFIFIMNTLNFIVSPVMSVNIPGFKTLVSKNQFAGMDIDNLKVKANFSSRIGIRFGLMAFQTRNFDVAVLTGFEKSYMRETYSFDNYHKETPGQDPDMDEYIRLVDLKHHEQRFALNFTELPLLISVNYKKFRNIEFSGTLGIRYSYLNKSTCAINSGFSIRGLYPQYSDLIIYDYYDFKSIDISDETDFPLRRNYMSYQLALSVNKQILHSVKVFAGLTCYIYNKPLITNTETKDILASDEKINNILYTYKKTRLQYVALEFGLICNLSSLNLNKIL